MTEIDAIIFHLESLGHAEALHLLQLDNGRSNPEVEILCRALEDRLAFIKKELELYGMLKKEVAEVTTTAAPMANAPTKPSFDKNMN